MKTVFFDVDTQLDFLFPAGALYVPGAEELISRLALLTRFASREGIQLISTVDAHSETDPEFQTWKPHCVAGTVGQQKAAVTLINQPIVLTTDPGALDQIRSRISAAGQIIVEKQQLDAFTNPHLRPLLSDLQADRYVLYGVVTELCVRRAAFGLLSSGARVELVTDAIRSLSAAEEADFIEKFQASGGKLTNVAAAVNA